MARKLDDIKKYIEGKNIQFNDSFYNLIDGNIKSFINELCSITNVYVFSGIIRDFFLNNDNIPVARDIDLIIEDDLNMEDTFNELIFSRNSFGGYKIKFDSVVVDLWVIKNTWALNQGQLKFEFDYLNSLPYTTFFNFSSILYSLNEKKFIIGKDFLRFLRDKKIELVLDKNPYPKLCIINSFYYSDKLELTFGKKLKSYLVENYMNINTGFNEIQLKHFNKVIYTEEDIKNRIKNIIKAQ